MAFLNLADWVDCTEVEGPGRRFALWVQGCLQRCPECCNPHMFDIVPRTIVEAGEVVRLVRSARDRYQIEGVSFLGGEPMLQAQGLVIVSEELRKDQLSVITFTGYVLEELQTMGLPGATALIALSDIIVDGPYRSDLPEAHRNWVGSANQRFHFLTSRYRPGIEYDPAFPHGFEVRVGKAGLRANGWPVALDGDASVKQS